MQAEILCVGTELLMGQILNTNAQFIARKLSALGIDLKYQQVVGDNEERLEAAYRLALSRSDIVITSGGLGPTVDDITKRVLARVAGRKMVVFPEAEEMVRRRFAEYHRNMTPNNRNQAMFAEGTRILVNHHGTAPGAIVPLDNGCEVIHLPGPPSELEPMFEESVMPYLEKRSEHVIVSRYIRIFGMGESEVDMRLKDLEAGSNPTLSPYCSLGEVMLRATASAGTHEKAEEILTPLVKEVRRRIGHVIYEISGTDHGGLGETAVTELKARGWTVAVSEDATGGLLASALAEIPESEQIFRGGMVFPCGAGICRDTAEERARGIREQMRTDLGISVVGTAVEAGDVPAGTVYLGISTIKGTRVKQVCLSGGRDRIRKLAVKHALSMILEELG